MVDWLDPSTWQGGVKAATAMAKLIESLRKKMARKGGAEPGADLANTRKTLGRLIDVVDDMLDLMKEANESQMRAAEVDAKVKNELLDVIKDLDERAKVLERAAKKKQAKASKKKPRKRK